MPHRFSVLHTLWKNVGVRDCAITVGVEADGTQPPRVVSMNVPSLCDIRCFTSTQACAECAASVGAEADVHTHFEGFKCIYLSLVFLMFYIYFGSLYLRTRVGAEANVHTSCNIRYAHLSRVCSVSHRCWLLWVCSRYLCISCCATPIQSVFSFQVPVGIKDVQPVLVQKLMEPKYTFIRDVFNV